MNRSKLIQPPAAVISAARCAYRRELCSAAAVGVSLRRMVAMNDNFALRDQVVLITGGARRIGAEIARTLHAAGANILIHYRSSASAAIALADEFNRMRAHSAAIFAAHLLND